MKYLLTALLFWGTFFSPAYAEDIDLALVLVVDISSSVNNEELALQREGLAAAFVHPTIVDAIQDGSFGKIAVAVVEFESNASVVVPWVLIHDKQTSEAFSLLIASKVLQASRGTTSISQGIIEATRILKDVPYKPTRKIVDISGDGRNNTEDYTEDGRYSLPLAREEALAAGIVINGLPIQAEEAGVVEFYREQVIGGRGSFLVVAESTFDFARAIRRKLVLELSLAPP